jgi:formylmethanofuran dehydrogenase subunit E
VVRDGGDGGRGVHTVKDHGDNSENDLQRTFEMKCHKCGEELPLLHPHIVVERYDEEDNMICESCFMNGDLKET